jgi:predicted DNA binding CopG/RHH family protein
MSLFGLFQPAKQPQLSEIIMISDTLKNRLNKERPMTSITLRIPVDVVESMKTIAPYKGFSGYQALLKSYISEGLRRNEAQFTSVKELKLIAALKKLGVSDSVIEEATREVA